MNNATKLFTRYQDTLSQFNITAGALRNRHWTGRPRKTTTADDGNIVRAVKKTIPKQLYDIH